VFNITKLAAAVWSQFEKEFLSMGAYLRASAGSYEFLNLLPILAIDAETFVSIEIPSKNLKCSSLVHLPLVLLVRFV
jgi:hypothetical protein